MAVVATSTLATGRADCENEGPWGFEDMPFLFYLEHAQLRQAFSPHIKEL